LIADNQYYDEKALLKAMAAGEEAGFNEIYLHYSQAIYYYILHMLKSPQLADDVRQEVFASIWERRSQLGSVESFKGYLFTTARNQTVSVLRSISRSNTAKAEMLKYLPLFRMEDLALNRDYERFIREVLQTLPKQTREVFIQCRQQGKSYEEVAKELGISSSFVKRHMINSIKALKAAADRDLGMPLGMTAVILSYLSSFGK